jgi:hypothetical protein
LDWTGLDWNVFVFFYAEGKEDVSKATSASDQDDGNAENGGWKVLSNDYMMNPKLRDWEHADDDEENVGDEEVNDAGIVSDSD